MDVDDGSLTEQTNTKGFRVGEGLKCTGIQTEYANYEFTLNKTVFRKFLLKLTATSTKI